MEKKIKEIENLRRQKTYEYFVNVVDVINNIKQTQPLNLLYVII